MRTSLVARAPRETFLEKLRALNDHVIATRDALIDLMPSAPTDEAAWLDTMSSPEVAAEIGKLLLLATKNASWANMTADRVLSILDAKLPATAASEVGAAVVAGQVEVEISCSCGQCHPCALRRDVGDEKARARIAEELSPGEQRTGRSRLVNRSGRPLSS